MRLRARVVGMTLALATVAFATGCQPDEEDLMHGFIKIEMRLADNAEPGIFGPTAQIVATLHYEECLTAFYDGNPNWHHDGVDGGPVFGGREQGGEGWKDRLCEDTGGEAADCTVTDITQMLDQIPQLRVRYAIPDSNLQGKFIRFGPLPTQELAMCEGGTTPRVRVSNSPVVGFDGGGNQVWITSSQDPPHAATNQGQAIRVSVAPPN